MVPARRQLQQVVQARGGQPCLLSLAITRELVGSFRFADEIDDAISGLADGSLDVGVVVSHRFGLDQTPEAFAVAADPTRSAKVLLDLRS